MEEKGTPTYYPDGCQGQGISRRHSLYPRAPPPEPSGARASLMGIGQEVGMQGLGLHMLTVAIVVCGSHGF